MDLPSMVERSGDKLIVRNLYGGNHMVLNDNRAVNANVAGTANNASNSSNNNSNGTLLLQQHQQQLDRMHAQQQAAIFQQSQQLELQRQAASLAAVEQLNQQAQDAKEEGLPQCKIKRNYSCNYCNYFTQNPRSHLMHLRDVHGERIVINKCERCLYASRHYQKLVRHMKMVHGCTDHVSSVNGLTRGKRGMNRDVRRRRIEESNAGANSALSKLDEMKRKQEQLMQQQTQQLMNSNSVELFKAFERYQRENQTRASWHQPSGNDNNNVDGNGNNNKTEANTAAAIPQASSIPTQPTVETADSGSNADDDAAASDLELSAESNKSLNMGALATAAVYADDQQLQNRLLKCSICDFTTPYPDLLIEHEAQDHNKTKFFRCSKCSYVTHIKARFSKHVKYHSMPMIKCCACDFRTPYKWNLDRHMKNHGGTGPFKCAACDFTADIKQSLTVHEMNHHVPPVGHATGMALARRRNKVGGTDCDDFLSDSTDLTEDQYNNNNNVEDFDEAMLTNGVGDVLAYRKRRFADDEEPTDLSQKGGSSDSSSLHNAVSPSKPKRPSPNLIPENALNLTDSRRSLNDIANMFLNDFLSPIDKVDAAAQLSPTATIASSTASQQSRSTVTKKGSLFDKLKSNTANDNLICPCGHTAKCLSESIMHRSSCKLASAVDAEYATDEEQDDADDRLEIDCAADDEDKQSPSVLNLSVSSSLRCQHCRHRCKSSIDLFNHIKHCNEAAHESYDSLSCESHMERASLLSAGMTEHSRHTTENGGGVFVWQKGNNKQGDGSEHSAGELQHLNDSANNSMKSGGILISNNEENSYYGVETAPGYGEVTKKMTAEEEAANSSLKKVYKCPHCSFWASTASRFHVHIVGHLNKKPFECSLCSYRSNWRWDITKHIRLKTIRDPSHKTARVLMNDETGRRNYTKYNKYITLMKVTEEDGDPKLMKSGEMTPNQVASLSFINDVNKHVAGSNAGLITGVQHLNGIKEDITLEPIIPNKQLKLETTQPKDDFIHLPWLATMVNAAMAQQQFKDQEQPATLITPSVTISAVKRSPVNKPKLEAELIKQEPTDEKAMSKGAFNCRQCQFGCQSQNELLEHMKSHAVAESSNYPIITATPTAGKNTGIAASATNVGMQQQNQPFLDFNPAVLMNNMLAALLQTPNGNQQLLQELLQQTLQSTNAPYGSMALANLMAQKNNNSNSNNNKFKAGAAASILEHGEQKAINNERHCRLKHNGDVLIEAYDRISDKNGLPIYRLITHNNNSVNDLSQHGNLNLKSQSIQQSSHAQSSQQHQQQQHFHANNSNNSLLLNKNEHLLQQVNNSSNNSASSARAINVHQNLHAAAAAFLSAFNAATGNSQQLSADEQLLQQQLQQNDQIEITRVPINNSMAGNTSNLAHLLEQSNNAAAAQHSKSKQQKCPHCPHVSESKSQMNYHVSLHKPTQYECSMCNFICSKKQHLSSHIRTAHQQQINEANAAINTAKLGLDASTMLQLAAAAQAQKHDVPSLAIDLRSLKSPTSSSKRDNVQTSPQQLPPEYKYKMISYCSKCPARFAVKHHEHNNAKLDLLEHLKCHSADEQRSFTCEFCDFCAAHDAQLQAHLYMHTQFYQSKCNEMFKNCKEDMDYAAPKLQQIKVTANNADEQQTPEMVWVVAPEPAKPQFASISSSSAAGNSFDNANSLLKKQLEAGPAPLHALSNAANSPKTLLENEEDSSSNTPSTSASVATSDLAGSESVTSASPALCMERCQHCPYESADNQQYKAHLQQHFCISQEKAAFACKHCDYSIDSDTLLQEHTRLHFNLSEKLKSVPFFTSYDKLELLVEQTQEPEEQNAEELPAAADDSSVSVKAEQLHNNNNNEENAINENMVQEQQQQQRNKTRAVSEKPEGAAKRGRPSLKRCTSVTKITFQKSGEGRVSIKKDAHNIDVDGICTRLRGRAHKQELQLNGQQHSDDSNAAAEEEMAKTVLVHHNTGQLLQ